MLIRSAYAALVSAVPRRILSNCSLTTLLYEETYGDLAMLFCCLLLRFEV